MLVGRALDDPALARLLAHDGRTLVEIVDGARHREAVSLAAGRAVVDRVAAAARR